MTYKAATEGGSCVSTVAEIFASAAEVGALPSSSCLGTIPGADDSVASVSALSTGGVASEISVAPVAGRLAAASPLPVPRARPRAPPRPLPLGGIAV